MLFITVIKIAITGKLTRHTSMFPPTSSSLQRYQYSLDSFVFFFFKAIDNAVAAEGLARVATLKSSMRYTIFQWVARGIFEKHKLLYVKKEKENALVFGRCL